MKEVLTMIKTLLRQIGEYKRDTIITPIFTVLEVVAELLVPFVIASLIDKGNRLAKQDCRA